MRESFWKKGIAFGIVFVLLSMSTALGSTTIALRSPLPGIVSQKVQANVNDIGGQLVSVGNVKVSPGSGNDSYPRMTTNAKGDIIIVYEQEVTDDDISMKTVPVVFSADEGDTWTQQFEFNSFDFQGSGFLSNPDIIYNSAQDILWFNAVDRLADMYNNEMYFIPGDIAKATEAIGYAISGSSTEYWWAACTHTNDYYLSLTSQTYPGFEIITGLGWFCYPDFQYPPGLGGFYYDGQSLIRTSPIREFEADCNANRWFLVAESEALEGGTQICIKSGSADKALIDSGEQQNGMDKYGDIEQTPGEFIGLGTDPDVSGSGNMVAVVFVREGDILCSVSSCVATYEPEFHWKTTKVDTGGASTPAVYMQGITICVAYVKNGNLYYKVSEDGGATWGDVQQKNDVNGTVIARKGSVDVCKRGIAFVDTRNGNDDVYFTSTITPAPELVISITGGIGIQAVIRNDGDAPATNVHWCISTEGLVLIGREQTGNISVLYPGDEVTVHSGIMLGFGTINVLVQADTAVKSQKFILFIIFMKAK